MLAQSFPDELVFFILIDELHGLAGAFRLLLHILTPTSRTVTKLEKIWFNLPLSLEGVYTFYAQFTTSFTVKNLDALLVVFGGTMGFPSI